MISQLIQNVTGLLCRFFVDDVFAPRLKLEVKLSAEVTGVVNVINKNSLFQEIVTNHRRRYDETCHQTTDQVAAATRMAH